MRIKTRKAGVIEFRKKEILNRISEAEKLRQKVIARSQELLNKLERREIDRIAYDAAIIEAFGERSLKEWIEYYDKYIKERREEFYSLDRLLKKELQKEVAFKFVPLVVLGLIFVVMVGYFFAGFGGDQVSFSPDEGLVLEIGEEFLENGIYEFELDERVLREFRLNGQADFGKFGDFEISLVDVGIDEETALLIYQESFGDEIALAPEEKVDESVEETNDEKTLVDEIDVIEALVVEDGDIEEIPEEIPEIESEVRTVGDFFGACIDTCNMENFDFKSGSYVLRVEISGDVKIALDSATYSFVPEEIVEDPIKEELEVVEPEDFVEERPEVETGLRQIGRVVANGEPVKWARIVDVDQESVAEVEGDVVEVKVGDQEVSEIESEVGNGIGITGNAILDSELDKYVVEKAEGKKDVDVGKIAEDTREKKFAIVYETPAPVSIEEEIPEGKRITLTSEVSYQRVLIRASVSGENVRVVKEDTGEIVSSSVVEGFVEFESDIESGESQSFLIIEIISAEHLNEQREFIADIFEEVREQDGRFSPAINDGEYVRVVFELQLDSSKDITVWPRVVAGDPRIEIYERDGNQIIAQFDSLNNDEYNTVFLTGLQGTQDTFDLRVVNGVVEFDHIIDPSINFDAFTPLDGSTVNEDSFNIGLISTSIGSNTRYTVLDFDDSILLWYGMEDTGSTITDLSDHGNDATLIGGSSSLFGRIGKGIDLTDNNERINIDYDDVPEIDITGSFSISAWINIGSTTDWQPIYAREVSVGNQQTSFFISPQGGSSAGGMRFTVDNEVVDVNQGTVGTGWHHVVAIFDDENDYGAIYLDGVLESEDTSFTATPDSIGNYDACIGEICDGRDNADFIVDEFIFFTRAIDESEVLSLNNSNTHQYSRRFENLANGDYNFTGTVVESFGGSRASAQVPFSGEREVTVSATGGLECNSDGSAGSDAALCDQDGEVREGSSDATFDSCADGSGNDAHISNMTVSSNVGFLGEEFTVSCDYDFSGYSNTFARVSIYYNDGNEWSQFGQTGTSTTDGIYTVTNTLSGAGGDRVFRCAISSWFANTFDSSTACVTGGSEDSYDHDDMKITTLSNYVYRCGARLEQDNGYYVLANNLTYSSGGSLGSCIRVEADNVVLDGNGYSINANTISALNAIEISKNNENFTLRDAFVEEGIIGDYTYAILRNWTSSGDDGTNIWIYNSSVKNIENRGIGSGNAGNLYIEGSYVNLSGGVVNISGNDVGSLTLNYSEGFESDLGTYFGNDFNLKIINSSGAEVVWHDSINPGGNNQISLSDAVSLAQNKISVSADPPFGDLDSGANITFYDLPYFDDPKLKRETVQYGVEDCPLSGSNPAGICGLVTPLNSNPMIFNVTSFFGANATYWIFDEPPRISFTSPTPDDGEGISEDSFEVNVSIETSSIDVLNYSFDGVNYSYYDKDLLLMLNFDNVANLGESSGTVLDMSRHNHSLNVVNANFDSEGRHGGAYDFDGDGDHIEVTQEDGSIMEVYGDEITMAAWVNASSFNGGCADPRIMAKADGTSGSSHDWMLSSFNGCGGPSVNGISLRMRVRTEDSPGSFSTKTLYSTDGNLVTDTWHYVVGTYNGSEIRMYVDGQRLDTNLIGPTEVTGDLDNRAGHEVSIGDAPGSGQGLREWDGLIDEIRIWNRSMTDNEVMHQYYSNLNKYDEGLWSLYVNQSGLTGGGQEYFANVYNLGGLYNETEVRSVNVENRAPQIVDIEGIGEWNGATARQEVYIIPGNLSTETFYIVVSDPDGFEDLDLNGQNTTVYVEISRGDVVRPGICAPFIGGEIGETSRNYSCTMDINYFDEYGNWSVTANATNPNELENKDSNNYVENDAFHINPSQAFDIGNINWATLASGTTIQYADYPLFVNNTGNVNLTEANLTGRDFCLGGSENCVEEISEIILMLLFEMEDDPSDGDIDDTSGLNHDGECNVPNSRCPTGNEEGVYGDSFYFDRETGERDYIWVDDHSDFDLTEGVTFGAWFKKDGSGSFDRIISKSFYDAGREEIVGSWLMYLDTNNEEVLCMFIVGGNQYTTSRISYSQDQWEFAACTFDGANDEIKIHDGDAFVGSTTSTTGSLDTSNYPIVVGAEYDADPQIVTSQFRGWIDNAFVFNRTLTDNELEEVSQNNFSIGQTEASGSLIPINDAVYVREDENSLQCDDGIGLINDEGLEIEWANVSYGDNSIGEGQEQLFMCFDNVPTGLPFGSYTSEWDLEFDFVTASLTLIRLFVLSVGLAGFAVGVRTRKKDERKLVDSENILEVLSEKLEKEYGVALEDLLGKVSLGNKIKDLEIPIEIFSSDIGPAEAVCKYLKENIGLSFVEIGKILNRDQRTVWNNYSNAVKKMKKKFVVKSVKVKISVDSLSNRKLSILESVVRVLKERGLRNVEIAELLGVDQRNVWTLHSRAKKKLLR